MGKRTTMRSYRIPNDLIELMKKVAKKHKVSLSGIVVTGIKEICTRFTEISKTNNKEWNEEGTNNGNAEEGQRN